MATVRPERWIVGISPHDRLATVAIRTLKARLGAVQQYLPLAGRIADADSSREANLEHVHQLRVATRRAAAAVKLFAELLPRRRAAWIERQLKRVRRAATEARDLDVLVERLAVEYADLQAHRAIDKFRARGAAARKPILAVYELLCRDDLFGRRIGKLLSRIPSRHAAAGGRGDERYGDWAQRRLQPIVERFFEAAPPPGSDLAALHEFRLRSKKLRYAMELVGTAFPSEFRESLYPVVEALQDSLGEINDLAITQARLERQLHEADDPVEARELRQLHANESARLEQAQSEFLDWCGLHFLEGLREEFERMLGGSKEPVISTGWLEVSIPRARRFESKESVLAEPAAPAGV